MPIAAKTLSRAKHRARLANTPLTPGMPLNDEAKARILTEAKEATEALHALEAEARAWGISGISSYKSRAKRYPYTDDNGRVEYLTRHQAKARAHISEAPTPPKRSSRNMTLEEYRAKCASGQRPSTYWLTPDDLAALLALNEVKS
jgi:hypothetical protein